ncbi:hypothetical protein CBR_g42138 [Chara braunii]|uniref:Argonaute linker 1 domain-containing protein n=1 Tax=Chara braunii TaxID=69332 RepID=A0A388LX55_CHABU|nr:hypothetical protein CBR_g42138 [Chara braunii]|eukprot:GBG86855.1 hypothetical protein CBR_g42138 [Chara braunii]
MLFSTVGYHWRLGVVGRRVAFMPDIPSGGGLPRKLMEEFRKKFLGSYAPLTIVFDGAKNLYSIQELRAPMSEVISFGEDGRPPKEYKIEVKQASRFDLNELIRFFQDSSRQLPQNILQSLEVALREVPAIKYVNVGRFFFDPIFGHTGMGGGLVSFNGFFQSLRPCQQGLMVNIDAKGENRTASAILILRSSKF